MLFGTPFSFKFEGIKKKLGLIRSKDGALIELANAFVDGGDHVNAIMSDHAYKHKGVTFVTGHFDATLASNGYVDVLLTVGATNQAHLAWPPTVESDGECLLSLYKAPTTTGGTDLTVFNVVDAVADDSSTVTAKHTPSVSNAGSLWEIPSYMPVSGANRMVGGNGASRAERILSVSTVYLVRIQNISATTKRVHAHLEWYDHSPITAKDQV